MVRHHKLIYFLTRITKWDKMMKRGIVRIKPIYIGIYHYQYVYGSVCSPDVKGTPPIRKITLEELKKRAEEMVERFKKHVDVDFIQIDEPFIIKKHKDFRKLPKVLNYDVDALLVNSIGATPLELYTLSTYGLPIIERYTTSAFLRALRVKKFLKESKFLYIGEIPSFSAPNGPWDFFRIQRRFGIRFRHIETNEFFRIFDSIPDDEARKVLEEWKKDFAKVVEPSEKDLLDVARVYLALRYLCEREDANAVTINCGRFTEERPIVPCLAFSKLIDEGIICGCEGDITALLSALILHAVSGQPVLMGNFGYKPGMFEAREGELTIEHDVLPLSMASTKYIVRDYHGRRFGVTAYADIKRGQPMTLLNMSNNLNEITVIEGTIKSSEDGGHCRVIIRMKAKGDVKRVSEILVGSQHISMTFGHWLDALLEVGKLLDLKVHHL
ncbi:MAG: hypothetical protein DRZ82_08275 [Thermoprotei archaeon]|nr:MAG: hypothetical protein DRZ82_08275 [Thermoprotei archaeon]